MGNEAAGRAVVDSHGPDPVAKIQWGARTIYVYVEAGLDANVDANVDAHSKTAEAAGRTTNVRQLQSALLGVAEQAGARLMPIIDKQEMFAGRSR